MSRLTKRTVLFFCLITPLYFFSGCSKPKEFPMAESIPLGDTKLVVSCMGTKSLGTTGIPRFGDFRNRMPGPGREELLIYISWYGERLPIRYYSWWLSEHGPDKFFKEILSGFALVDNSGKKYPLILILPESLLRIMEMSGTGSFSAEMAAMQQFRYDIQRPVEEFVLVFEIPAENRNMRLRIKNPYPQKGQPGLLFVRLS